MKLIVLGLYSISAIVEILGIMLTVADVRIKENDNGTITLSVPLRWRKARGPVLIGVGALIGLISNAMALYAI